MKTVPLGDISLDTFFAEYWQKKPLLVRHALPGNPSPIAADELAGLACEEGVESRLIIHDGISQGWELQHGPFTDETFRTLPESHWTLLVQAVDHWVPEAGNFLDQFDFIPSWRVDDLMISYSSDAGGVGPHFDYYDVFLVQVSGRRQWEIGGLCDDSSPCRPDTPLLILSEWVPKQRWILEPGDLLYVPPRVGHSGIAVGNDCMTCSVGFRAPSHREILRDYTDYVGEKLLEGDRYSDPDLVPQTHPGLMTPDAIKKVHAIVNQYLEGPDQLADWFGRYMTRSKYPEQETSSHLYDLKELRAHLLASGTLLRNEGSRYAYQERGQELWLFVDGRRFTCRHTHARLVKTLCAERTIKPDLSLQSEDHLQLLLDLLNHGSLYLSD